MQAKLHGSIIVTYRCNARCNMCSVWQHPTKPDEEISSDVMRKLPDMFFCNVTGGEPFIRQDLPEIIEILRKKSHRIVISTNGYFTERIVALCKKNPDIGIRISIEGQERSNDMIRGIPQGFQKAWQTLLALREMGLKDIGFAMTVQDQNVKDLVPLYKQVAEMGYEFATAVVHNSHYFHKWDNTISNKGSAIAEFKNLITLLLGSKKAKDWFRAYFNYGLINYINGERRLLPCEMGKDGFFLDPWGDVLVCNGMDEKQPIGNLKKTEWDDIWDGEKAKMVRDAVRKCAKNCWMIGSAAPAIWHHPIGPVLWVVKNKIRLLFGKEVKI